MTTDWIDLLSPMYLYSNLKACIYAHWHTLAHTVALNTILIWAATVYTLPTAHSRQHTLDRAAHPVIF